MKKLEINSNNTIEPLNNPKGWDIFNLPGRIKTASIKKDGDYGGFDITSAIKQNPDHLFLKIFAIKEDECNDNGDSFPKEELKKSASTFIGVPLFTNHQNNDIEKAKGICVHSWYDESAKGIYIIGKVDCVGYPKLARGISTNIVIGTSMGASVEKSICSICHNLAHNEDELCHHVKNGKNRKISSRVKNAYHDSPSKPKDDDPLTGKKENEEEYFDHKEARVYEHNFGIKFVENSFVVNPACHECGVKEILNEEKVSTKLAQLNKIAIGINDKFTKEAGAKEVQLLKDSMSNCEQVIKSMFKQKDYVSVEYVSDIVEAMKKLESTLDDLVESGYTNLPSPDIQEDIQPYNPMPIQQPQEQELGNVNIQNSIGTITSPKLSSEKEDNFLKISKRINNIKNNVKQLNLAGKNKMSNGVTVSNSDSNYSVTFENDHVIEANGDNILKYAHIDTYDNETKEIYSNSMIDAGHHIINNLKRETMSNKTSQKVGGDQSKMETTEGQLEGANLRTGTFEQITESSEQIGRSGDLSNDSTTNSPQKRLNNTPETITEDQLASNTNHYKWSDAPEVITEGQWTEMSRRIDSKLSGDAFEQITESQLRDLLSHHKFVGPYDVITEGQLSDQIVGIKRWASKDYTSSLAKVASNVVKDLLIAGKDTNDIKEVTEYMSENLNKLTYTLANNKIAETSFNKFASSLTIADEFVNSLANNGKFAMNISDVLEVIPKVLDNNKLVSKLQKTAKENSISNIDKSASIDNALNDLENEGKYQINCTAKEICAKTNDKSTFIKAAKSFAQEKLAQENNTITLEIKVSPDGGVSILNGDEGMFDEVEDDDLIMFDGCGDLDDVVFDEDGDVEENDVEKEMKMMTDDSDDLDFDLDSAIDSITNDDDEEDGLYEPTLSDSNSLAPFEGDLDKDELAQLFEKPSGFSSEASSTKQIKQAQMLGGDMGMPDAGPGAGGAMPQDPMMGGEQDPLESLSGGDEGIEEAEDDSLLPKPPGSTCPVCSSEDVDVVEGKGKCNNCHSEFTIKVTLDVTKWADLTGEDKDEDGDGLEGEGFEAPENGLPVAAMTKITPNTLQKLAEIKQTINETEDFAKISSAVEKGGFGIRTDNASKIASSDFNYNNIGQISPITGSFNTMKIAKNEYVCVDSGTKYKVDLVVSSKNPKDIYAQWSWTPRIASCTECSRSRNNLIKSLDLIGVSEESFNNMNVNDKTTTLLKAKQASQKSDIKIASTLKNSVIDSFKETHASYDSFPMESCREKIANRYGKNAIAMSGPCEGKPLYDCVCNSLKQASVYSNGLALKIADSWSDVSQIDNCVTDQIKDNNLTIAQATDACKMLRLAFGEDEDLLEDELEAPSEDMWDSPETSVSDEEPIDDVDPFDGDIEEGGEGTVTLELDADVAEALKQVLDAATDSVSDEELDDSGIVDDVVDNVVDEPLTEEDTLEEDTLEEDNLESVDGLEEEAPMDEETSEDSEVDLEGEDLDETEEVVEEFDESKPMCDESKPMCDKSVTDEGETFKEGVSEKKSNNEYTKTEASNMRDHIGKTGKINMDLDNLINVLANKNLKQENVQDAVDNNGSNGNPLDGKHNSTMGHEQEAIADAKSGPDNDGKGDSAMGHEKELGLNLQDVLNSVPSGNSEMGHEKELGYTSEDPNFTGGDEGQGKIAENIDLRMKSSSEHLDNLFNILTKQAKKLEAPKPVSEDKDIQPIQDGSTMGKEEKPNLKGPGKTEESGNQGQMGNEGKVTGDTPKSPKDLPDVGTGDSKIGNETLDSEKTTKDKGTVIASSNSESKMIVAKATELAGRMVKAGIVNEPDLLSKIHELSSYKISQLNDIDKMLNMKVASKGFNTVGEGLETPLVLSSSNNNPQENLKNNLRDIFTLDSQNNFASKSENYELSKLFK